MAVSSVLEIFSEPAAAVRAAERLTTLQLITHDREPRLIDGVEFDLLHAAAVLSVYDGLPVAERRALMRCSGGDMQYVVVCALAPKHSRVLP